MIVDDKSTNFYAPAHVRLTHKTIISIVTVYTRCEQKLITITVMCLLLRKSSHETRIKNTSETYYTNATTRAVCLYNHSSSKYKPYPFNNKSPGINRNRISRIQNITLNCLHKVYFRLNRFPGSIKKRSLQERVLWFVFFFWSSKVELRLCSDTAIPGTAVD